MMKTLFLNLPHPSGLRIQRRYMCSYYAQNMLFPPQELIALAGIVRDWKQDDVFLIDAMAEQLSQDETLVRIQTIRPDVLVTISGFSCFEDDMETLNALHQQLPDTRIVLFGHYPSLFAKDILARYAFDYIILGEPDLIFSDLFDALKGQKVIEDVHGVAYRKGDEPVLQTGEPRIKHPEELPMPAYELLQADRYFEPFMDGPFGLIQTARGCPFPCNYCVTSFGKRLTYRSPEQIVDEISFLKEKHHIRSLRFIDDTFTVNSQRVIDICQMMLERQLNLTWTCLSRTDTLKPDMLEWMQRAGCKRIYFGIESGSAKVLKYLNKELDINQSLASLRLCKQLGIETMGFFLVGVPTEEETDVQQSIDFAIEADFDYVVVSELSVYPGTPLFEKVKSELDFSILPYRNAWKDAEWTAQASHRAREFYKKFYFRPKYLWGSARRALKYPVKFIKNAFAMLKFLFKKAPKNRRRDYM